MSRFPELALALALTVSAPAAAEAPKVGRPALPEEIAAWDIDVRPDGKGLPKGAGTVRQGEAVFQERCAFCHGEFGEGIGRWPELAGGQGSLTAERPIKTIGSYWPYASTVFDFVRRAMPFGNAQSLTVDETYAVVAYLLNLNDILADPDFELNERSLATIRLPNAGGFYDDDRDTTERAFWSAQPCMQDCRPPVRVTSRARVLDVTPDPQTAPRVE
jgi:cytochrome c